MIPLFLGLTAANLILLLTVFTLGLTSMGAPHLYAYHLAFGVTAGLMVLLTHISVYVYFMATSRWLGAASDKAALDVHRYVQPAEARKRRVFLIVMAAISVTMLAMFAGAGADPAIRSLWPIECHLALAFLAITVNLLAALTEFQHIRRQGRLIDEAAALVSGDAHASTAA